MSHDHHCWGEDTNSGDEINLYASITAIPPELINYMASLEDAIKIFPGVDQWLSDGQTITHGRTASVRTEAANREIIVNHNNTLIVMKVVDIYVPTGFVESRATTVNSVGPNHLRLLGHLNGKEAEAIILDTNVAIHLVVDLVLGTTRIVEKEILPDTTFTAAIYEIDAVDITPFTAEIYEESDEIPEISFTAEIYEDPNLINFTAEIYEA